MKRTHQPRPRPHSPSGGFTLLEVLVAFAILAIMIVPILQIFGDGLGRTRTVQSYAEAAELARSKLAAIGIEQPLREGETSGTFPGGYQWRTSITLDKTPIEVLTEGDGTGPSSKQGKGNSGFGRGSGSSSSLGSSTGSGRSAFSNTRSNTGSSGSSTFGNSSSTGSGRSAFGNSSSSSGSSGFGNSSSSFGNGSSSSGSSAFGSSSGSSAFGNTQSSSGRSSVSGLGPGVQVVGSEANRAGAGGLNAYRITVTVDWGHGASIVLSTVRVGGEGDLEGRGQ